MRGGVNAEAANFSGTNLASAGLVGANLSRSNLASANLSECNLSWGNLSGCDVSGANFAGVVGLATATLDNLRGLSLSGTGSGARFRAKSSPLNP